MDQIVGKVYESRDYEKFKKLVGNRDVNNARKKRIRQSLDAVGQLYVPIIVNENMEVLDGQARLEVFSERELPIWYVICRGGGKKECVALNAYGTIWTTMDYVNSYCQDGNENYVRLKRLVDDYPRIALSTFDGIVKKKIINGGGRSWVIKDGKFVLSENRYKEVKEMSDWLMTFIGPIKSFGVNQKTLMTLLCWCYQVKGIDAERLKKIFLANYPNIYPPVDIVKSLAQFSELYNKNMKKKIYLDAIYREERDTGREEGRERWR